jgi:hypothetical protein
MTRREARRVGAWVAMMSLLTVSLGHAQDAAGPSAIGGSPFRNHPHWAPPLPGDPMPLTTAVLSTSRAHAGLPVQAPPDRAPSTAGCRTHAVLGTVIGAGVGTATAAGVLAATGGSDSTFKIVFNFAGVGAVGGLLIGSSVCRK